jgi:hypothetical protein
MPAIKPKQRNLISSLTVALAFASAIAACASDTHAHSAQKPVASDAIQYVSPSGSDKNDGLSWSMAKLTMVAALEALPGGSVNPPIAGQGEVIYTDGVSASPTANAGIWLMDSNDPNYASPPTGWLRVSGPLLFQCYGGKHFVSSSHAAVCSIVGGSSGDTSHPVVWLNSGITLQINGAYLSGAGTALKIGINSNGDRVHGGGVNISFDAFGAASTIGPTVDIGNNVFWLYFHNFGINGVGGLAPSKYLTDQQAAVLIDPDAAAGGGGVGLIHFEEGILDSSGIILRGGTNGGAVDVDKVTTENAVSPLVWLSAGGVPPSVRSYHLEVADCWPGSDPNYCVAVRNDTSVASLVMLWDIQGGVVGPYTSLGNPVFLTNDFALPSTNGSVGMFGKHLAGLRDDARRLFAPSAVSAVNLSNQNPATWSTKLCSSCTVTLVTAPDGTRNAGQVATTARGQQGIVWYINNSETVAVGDRYLYGVWALSQTGNGFNNGVPMVFQTNTNGFGAGVACDTSISAMSAQNLAQYGTRGWAWYSGMCTITAAPNAAGAAFGGHLDSTHTAQFYAPILLKFPAGTISDNEAYEKLASLSPYSASCAVGTICGLPGQILHEDAFNVKLSTPTSSSNTCIVGTIWADSQFVYVCTATNTIKRSALSSF